MTEALRQTAGTRQGPGLPQIKRICAGAGAAAAAFMLVLSPGSGIAQQRPATAEEAKRRLEADKSKLEQTQRIKQELQSDVEKISAERERINARMVETGKLIQQSV